MSQRVVFHPAARADLFDLYDYIHAQSGPERAGAYMVRIEQGCRRLGDFPASGRARPDIAIGIRTIALDRRILIAFRVTESDVVILRVLYAGRDFQPDGIPS